MFKIKRQSTTINLTYFVCGVFFVSLYAVEFFIFIL